MLGQVSLYPTTVVPFSVGRSHSSTQIWLRRVGFTASQTRLSFKSKGFKNFDGMGRVIFDSVP